MDIQYHGGYVVRATRPSGESSTVRAADLDTAACRLAEQVCIDVVDG